MHPIALEIGSLSIRWYGVMAAIGFLVGTWVLEKNRKFANMDKDQCSALLIIALICGILGARIFYVVQFFDHYRYNLVNIIRIDQGGLVFYGGFILALAAVIIYSVKQKLDPIRVLDVMAPVMAAAHAFGRIGCYLNGCCYGKVTESIFGVTPPAGSELALRTGGMPLFPVQLLEAGENFLLCALYWYLLRRIKRPGIIMSLFFINYGALRFLNEMLRGDNVLYWKFTPAQWIGLCLIPAGIGLIILFTRIKCNEKN